MAEPFAIVVQEPKVGPVVINDVASSTSVVNIGAKGDKGEKGEAGSGGDLHFKFTQGVASAEWKIEHNLEKFPSVTVQDSANENVEGFCEYVNENKLILTFSAAFSGTAYLN